MTKLPPRYPGKRPPPKTARPSAKTSWEPVEKWYNQAVGEEGLYYHKQIILPGVLRLMDLKNTPAPGVLDLACGQGILARQLHANIPYTGIDISTSLVKAAKELDKNAKHHYLVGDATKPLPLKNQLFSHVTVILALQNIEHPLQLFQEANKHLLAQGKLILVLNHPCFRIPRQSSWQVDESKKLQYRRLDRYFTPIKIPIQAHPSKGEKSAETWSFHYSLSAYTAWLREAGFVIEVLEEWCSDKVSTGAVAKMENRSRAEFPLFLTIVASKTA